ncbi:hypothetical protein PIB30_001444 [Stylosanthes scabra]|uniref:Uncharacterized protein n=1 Tax=Stylosanthes scabra TaxID=79078 RepID=A0ABU6Q2E9_9FABA|nr:hypothetical protein [Stylosanthes scabra]
MAVIKSLDEQVSANAPALETPQQTQVEDDDFKERVATLATVPKGDNDYELIFDLRGPRTLKAMRFQFDSTAPKSYIDIQVVGLMCHILNGEEGERYEKMVYCIPPEILTRMLEAHHHNWIDKKKRRPHEIASLTNHFSLHQSYTQNIGGYMFWIRMGQKSNILSQLLRWAGAPTILKKGSWSLLPTYINPMLIEFRKKIVAKIILSKENTMRVDAIRAAHEMRRTKPSAALRSPFLPFSTPDLPST